MVPRDVPKHELIKEWGQDVYGAGCVPQGASILQGSAGVLGGCCPGTPSKHSQTSGSGAQAESTQASNWMNRYSTMKRKGERAEEERAEEGMSIIPAPSSPVPALPLVPRHFHRTCTHARAEEGQGHHYASPATQRRVQSSSC